MFTQMATNNVYTVELAGKNGSLKRLKRKPKAKQISNTESGREINDRNDIR